MQMLGKHLLSAGDLDRAQATVELALERVEHVAQDVRAAEDEQQEHEHPVGPEAVDDLVERTPGMEVREQREVDARELDVGDLLDLLA